MSLLFGSQARAAQIDPFVAAELAGRFPSFQQTFITADSAQRKVAVGSAVRLFTFAARSIPVYAYRGHGPGIEPMPNQPRLLLDPDGSGRGFGDWFAQAIWSALTRGNTVGQTIARDNFGNPSQVRILHPDMAQPREDREHGVNWHVGGKTIPTADIMHVRPFPVPGVVLGMTPIQQHAATIGLAVSSEKFGIDFFDSGGHPTGILQSDQDLKKESGEAAKQRFLAATANREPVFLPGGIKYQQIQISPSESMFLDAQKYTAAECARIYGPGTPELLGYETGGSMQYQNVVDRDLHWLKYSFDPYLFMFEQLLSSYLPKPQMVRFDRSTLLRMNILDRYKAYQIAAEIGLQPPNEQRAAEGWGPVEWGDKPFPQTRHTVTERIGLDASTPTQAAADMEGAAP